MPYAAGRRAAVIERKGRFVHYTSAASALNIINTKTIWMRSTTCMSDYSEVQHAFNTLNSFFLEETKKTYFFRLSMGVPPKSEKQDLNTCDCPHPSGLNGVINSGMRDP